MIELTAECLFSYSASKVLLIAREDCAEQWPPTPHTRPTDHWLLLIVFLFSWHSTVCIEGRGSAGYTPPSTLHLNWQKFQNSNEWILHTSFQIHHNTVDPYKNVNLEIMIAFFPMISPDDFYI